MTEHPDIAEHKAKHGVVHTSLGRRLDRVAKTAADEIHQSGEHGPIPHAEQEKRLAEPKWDHEAFPKFEPAKIAVHGASGYASKLHLPDPHANSYKGIHVTRDSVREIGRAYDALPTRDASAIPHFEKMRKEVVDQHDHLTHAMGIKTEVVDHDPYPSVHHMVNDVLKNKRIKVLSTKVTGGHDFLSDDENDKFRAVHDVFGHAATGRGFDRHGEEAAWLAHSRMFTQHARGAMSSETRGQNAALHLNGSFQDQKTALLPSHLWDDSAVNKHSTLLPFEAFLAQAGDDHGARSLRYRFVHGGGFARADCKEPGCGFGISRNDPGFEGLTGATADEAVRRAHQDHVNGSKTATRKVAHDSGDGETIYHCPFCGSGQVIARSDRTIECQFCHTCFTVQVQPEYSAFPQTVNGVPVQVPGMPGQVGMDPSGMGGPAPDPMAEDGGNPFAEEGEEEAPEEEPEEDGNPFTKGSALRTTAGKELAVDDYVAHLALRHAADRGAVLEAVRARRV